VAMRHDLKRRIIRFFTGIFNKAFTATKRSSPEGVTNDDHQAKTESHPRLTTDAALKVTTPLVLDAPAAVSHSSRCPQESDMKCDYEAAVGEAASEYRHTIRGCAEGNAPTANASRPNPLFLEKGMSGVVQRPNGESGACAVATSHDQLPDTAKPLVATEFEKQEYITALGNPEELPKQPLYPISQSCQFNRVNGVVTHPEGPPIADIELHVYGVDGRKLRRCLVLDSGSAANFISKQVQQESEYPLEKADKTFLSACGNIIYPVGLIKGAAFHGLGKARTFTQDFYVLEDPGFDCLVGWSFCGQAKVLVRDHEILLIGNR